ncbi:MAG: hypothetical protein LUG93_11435 [Lachnospiraceae bacterium]|nr:hypothetical protein [Lachnospiraceae bacterium]
MLRNYEKFPEELINNEHADIDVLCENVDDFILKLGLEPFYRRDDRIHFAALVDGFSIPIDLRCPGDGYYCEKWEKNMLLNRVLYKNKIFVMSPSDYFYSLTYHALIHKQTFSTEYLSRLISMGKELGIMVDSENELKNRLLDFLKKEGYFVTNSSDVALRINVNNIPNEYIQIKKSWAVKSFCANLGCGPRRFLRKILHF